SLHSGVKELLLCSTFDGEFLHVIFAVDQPLSQSTVSLQRPPLRGLTPEVPSAKVLRLVLPLCLLLDYPVRPVQHRLWNRGAICLGVFAVDYGLRNSWAALREAAPALLRFGFYIIEHTQIHHGSGPALESLSSVYTRALAPPRHGRTWVPFQAEIQLVISCYTIQLEILFSLLI